MSNGNGRGEIRASWHLVVPAKRAAAAKTRLLVEGADRAELARALLLDTVAAAACCRAVARVLIVTADPETAEAAASFDRVEVLADTASDLRSAIALGVSVIGEQHPRAILLGDLPALRPEELAEALGRAARRERSFVRDAEGSGTTLATARAGAALPALFGPESATAHATAGFAEIALPASSGLRRDVDTAPQLRQALALGCGSHTTAALPENMTNRG